MSFMKRFDISYGITISPHRFLPDWLTLTDKDDLLEFGLTDFFEKEDLLDTGPFEIQGSVSFSGSSKP